MEPILKMCELTKTHNGTTVVDNVSMQIMPGEIFGLVGPNGAGKTTLMKMILNLVKPTHGELDIFGESIQGDDYSYLGYIGSIIETPQFMEDLTVLKNMEIHAAYYGYHNTQRIDEVLDRVGMLSNKNMPVNRCSLGMKQRLAIARAMLCQPKLLILDEPVNGLDPEGMKSMRDVLRKLSKEEHVTILVSSHILSELEHIVDSVGIMKNGALVEQLSMKEIQSRNLEYYVLETTEVKKALIYLSEVLEIKNCRAISENQIRIYDQSMNYQALLSKLVVGGFEFSSFEKEKKTLEDYFISQTNRGDTHA